MFGLKDFNISMTKWVLVTSSPVHAPLRSHPDLDLAPLNVS